jgi:hypothetical protein
VSYQIIAEVPVEPADRAVVLDKDGLAWQRIGETWAATGGHLFGGKHWRHLVVDRGPLTLLAASDHDPARAASYLDEALGRLRRSATHRRDDANNKTHIVDIETVAYHDSYDQIAQVADLLRSSATRAAGGQS